jgi:hypothetical protein
MKLEPDNQIVRRIRCSAISSAIRLVNFQLLVSCFHHRVRLLVASLFTKLSFTCNSF